MDEWAEFRRGTDQDEASWSGYPTTASSPLTRLHELGTLHSSSNTWVNDGVAGVSLYDSFLFELGAAFLLPSGNAFFWQHRAHRSVHPHRYDQSWHLEPPAPTFPTDREPPMPQRPMMSMQDSLRRVSDSHY